MRGCEEHGLIAAEARLRAERVPALRAADARDELDRGKAHLAIAKLFDRLGVFMRRGEAKEERPFADEIRLMARGALGRDADLKDDIGFGECGGEAGLLDEGRASLLICGV